MMTGGVKLPSQECTSSAQSRIHEVEVDEPEAMDSSDRRQSSNVATSPGQALTAHSQMDRSAAPSIKTIEPGSSTSTYISAEKYAMAWGTDREVSSIFASAFTPKTKSGPDQAELEGQTSFTLLPLSSSNLQTDVAAMSKQHVLLTAQGIPKLGGSETGAPRTEDPARGEQTERPSPALTNISSARLTQKLTESEMRVDLRSEDFGQVSVHSTLGKGSVSTQITLDNTQLGATLLTHVRELEQRLDRDHGLHASVSIDTRSGSGSLSGNSREGEPKSDHYPVLKQSLFSAADTAATEAASANPTSRASGTSDSQRIDVRI